LGTPRVIIDPTRGAQGTTIWRWDLTGEAFGTTAPNQNPDGDATNFVFSLRFPGQRYDGASGLNYNYFRDYEATTGRYVESDPIGLGGGISTYLYANGAPYKFVDATGKASRSPLTCSLATFALLESTKSAVCPGKGSPFSASACRPGQGCISHLVNVTRFNQCASVRAIIQTACYGGSGVYGQEIANAYRGAYNCAKRALEECGEACKASIEAVADQARRNAEAAGAVLLIGGTLILTVLFGS